MAGELDRGEDSPAARRQIAAYYRDAIEAGELPAGTRMPSSAQIAELFGVHADTAKAALGILAHEGLVRVYPRVGAVVAGEDPEHEHVIDGPAVIRARMPTGPERQALDVPPGVPLLVVSSPAPEVPDDPDAGGETVTQYLAHVSRLVIL